MYSEECGLSGHVIRFSIKRQTIKFVQWARPILQINFVHLDIWLSQQSFPCPPFSCWVMEKLQLNHPESKSAQDAYMIYLTPLVVFVKVEKIVREWIAAWFAKTVCLQTDCKTLSEGLQITSPDQQPPKLSWNWQLKCLLWHNRWAPRHIVHIMSMWHSVIKCDNVTLKNVQDRQLVNWQNVTLFVTMWHCHHPTVTQTRV